MSNKSFQKKKTLPNIPWPSDFILTDKLKDYAIKNGIAPNKVCAFFEDFHNWADQNEKKYKVWEAAFRTRVGKAPEYGKQYMVAGKIFDPKQDDDTRKHKDYDQIMKEKGMV